MHWPILISKHAQEKGIPSTEYCAYRNFRRYATDIPLGSFLISEKSIGFDGMLNFYAGRDSVSDLEFEAAMCKHLNWNPQLAAPYVVNANAERVERIGRDEMLRGVTISANGFYGPQTCVAHRPCRYATERQN
jgi:uridine phosphorylase